MVNYVAGQHYVTLTDRVLLLRMIAYAGSDVICVVVEHIDKSTQLISANDWQYLTLEVCNDGR